MSTSRRRSCPHVLILAQSARQGRVDEYRESRSVLTGTPIRAIVHFTALALRESDMLLTILTGKKMVKCVNVKTCANKSLIAARRRTSRLSPLSARRLVLLCLVLKSISRPVIERDETSRESRVRRAERTLLYRLSSVHAVRRLVLPIFFSNKYFSKCFYMQI